jgi:hypothetical protein
MKKIACLSLIDSTCHAVAVNNGFESFAYRMSAAAPEMSTAAAAASNHSDSGGAD